MSCLLNQMQQILLLYVRRVLFFVKKSSHHILFAPFFRVFSKNFDKQFISFESDGINAVVRKSDEHFENCFVEKSLMSEELLQDVYDFAFDAPVICSQLLQERLDNFII